jgi:hypothetical protein
MQFVGFESKAMAREYTFTLREDSSEPRQFTIIVANEAEDLRNPIFTSRIRRSMIIGTAMAPQNEPTSC